MAIRQRRVIIGAALVALAVALWFGGRALFGRGGGGHAGGATADDGAGAGLGSDDAAGPRRPIHLGSGDRDPTVAMQTPAVIEGTVRDARTHEPVAGATVAFWNAKGEQTTDSGSDGHYSIEITTGRWSCAAMDDGARVSVPQTIEASTKNAPVDFELGAISRVHGVVRDAAGRPVAGAEVSYDPKERAVREAFEASIGRSVTTGGDGAFQLPVMPGEVRLRATTAHQLAHKVVPAVQPGADVAVDLVLGDLVAVDGRVVDDKGAPVADASVEAFVAVIDIDLNVKRTMTTGADGRFAFANLPAGWLTLSARTKDGGLSRPMPQTELHGDLHDAVLTLEPPVPVSGRVVYGDGRPARRVQVRARRNGYAGRWAETSTDDDGAFHFAGAPDGTFDITAEAEAGSGMALGASSAKPVEITLHVPGGIRGTVHLGKQPASTFTIALDRFVPAGNATGIETPPTQRFSVPDGRFEWPRLPPGEYDLLVHAPGGAATPVHTTVQDGAWAEVDVALAPGATATGKVHAGATPIAGARIDVYCTGQSTFSGADGSFTLADLPATGCWTTIVADGYETFQHTIAPGAPADVALRPAGGR